MQKKNWRGRSGLPKRMRSRKDDKTLAYLAAVAVELNVLKMILTAKHVQFGLD